MIRARSSFRGSILGTTVSKAKQGVLAFTLAKGMHRLRLITMHDPMNAFPTIEILGIREKRDENGELVVVVEIVPDALDCGESLAAQPHKSTDEIATEAGCRCH